MKSLTFSCLICALSLYCAQTLLRMAKFASRLLEPQKVAHSTIGKGLPACSSVSGLQELVFELQTLFSFKITHRKLSGQNVPLFFEKSKVNKSDK